ncbi:MULTISPECIES: hypothetical protein [Phenylobacterium]|uniref:Uncharacterized protein n=1 Tax=Phenylobacterium koreense TaxID=266125 RepID=A0ABV2EGY7_9CAUL
MSDRLAYVLNPSAVDADGIVPLSGVGFPRDSVFSYDASLADSLEGAWRNGDRERLAELWSSADEIWERSQ